MAEKRRRRFDPHSIARWLRYACYLVVLYSLWYFSSNFSFVRVLSGDDSVIGVTGRCSLVLAKYESDQVGPERDEVVVFLMADKDDNPVKRISRVVAVPGDVVHGGDEFVEVNGEPTRYAASQARLIEGRVPNGMYVMLNDNPFSTFPDSRRMGFIPRQVILGRLLCEAPF